MNIHDLMAEKGLDATNTVVIGSGILSAIGIRPSNDIDVVVDAASYAALTRDPQLSVSETHGREILVDELFEIGTSWEVLGRQRSFTDLVEDSVIIDDVRYITLDFLLRVKKDWIEHDEVVRQKDVDDVELIEAYLAASGT